MNKNPTRRLFVGWTFLGIVFGIPSATTALPERPTGYITDEARVLGDRAKMSLENVSAELEQKTGVQLAVLTVSSLEGRDVAEAAEQMFRAWGIGRKGADDGILLLVAPSERKASIEVGYGMEGLIPDARVGRILDEQAIPRFRAGDIENGIVATTLTLSSIIAADRGVSLTGVDAPPQPRPMPGWLALLILMLAGYVVIRHPWLLLLFLRGGGRHRGGGWSGGGFGGFGGFGGGRSGGGGASRGW